MKQVPELQVRRARPSDAERIAAFINQARSAGNSVTPQEVKERFGIVGFLLAERKGELVGILGWLVENLVARVTDFFVWPAGERLVAGHAMISSMERAALELQCEASVIFLPRHPSSELLAFWNAFGYRMENVSALPKAWREAAREIRSLEEQVVVKQLRQNLIHQPL